MSKRATNFTKGNTSYASSQAADAALTSRDLARDEMEKRAIIKRARESLLDQIRPVKPQWEAFVDPSKRICLSCSRRAGKTYLLITTMLDTVLSTQDADVVYISDTLGAAKARIWNPLLSTISKHQLDRVLEVQHGDLTIHCPRLNSRIRILGCPDETGADKVRGGLTGIALACVDECQSIKSDVLEYLLKECLAPALRETQGKCILAGTPSEDLQGYFYRAAMGQTPFHPYSWTAEDNRMYPIWAHEPDDKWQEIARMSLEQTRLEEGLAADDPRFLREWKGIWIADTRNFIYSINDENILQTPPNTLGLRVLGVDLGFEDHTAFSVLSYSRGGKIYQIYEDLPKVKIMSDIADEIRRLHGIYNFESIVIDPNAGGKNLGYEITTRFGIPVHVAERTQKKERYLLIQSALHKRDLYLLPKTAVQMKTLVWDSKHARENDKQECDLSDSTMYAFTRCFYYVHSDPAQGPSLTSNNNFTASFDQELDGKKGKKYGDFDDEF